MKLSDFDYYLPKELIAQKPAKPRDYSRLLVLCKQRGEMKHKHFYDIVGYFKKGDVLVLNDTKVFPARLIGKRKETGGKVEVFLLRNTDLTPTLSLPRRGGDGEVWQCLVGGHRRKENLDIEFLKGLIARVIKNNNDGTWLVAFNKKGKVLMDIINKIGQVPLPPYIKRNYPSALQFGGQAGGDIMDYQTVYADERKIGSVAAPTAGFHFTKKLLVELKRKGVKILYITLHVGLGTFAPVKVYDITKHKMHEEWVEVNKKVADEILKAKIEKRRVVAVGTTTVRTLEAVFTKIDDNHEIITRKNPNLKSQISNKIKNYKSKIQNYNGWVNIFIYPGYKFRIIDAMITNFHLPKSTLLMLVSAFAGKVNIDKAYKIAIQKKYRFYSYGDAMLIF